MAPVAASTATMAVTKPIPALYTVYVLRSSVRKASVYIGSTPDPPRRLKQHNGLIKGGAARTSRPKLRPWEMVALVSGFPGSVAALKFEWALANPHLSRHIPSDERITTSRLKKRNGRPRRPPKITASVVANLHLLLRVPSFARWPLRLHVFHPDVMSAWEAVAADSDHDLDTRVVVDFEHGVHGLAVDYTPLRDYVDKAHKLVEAGGTHDCAVCHEALRLRPPGQTAAETDSPLHAVCSNDGCHAVGHLSCWGRCLLSQEAEQPPSSQYTQNTQNPQDTPLVPVRGHCPTCGGPVVWADMMKELTLRLRAPAEVEKLLKSKRREEQAEEKEAARLERAAAKMERDAEKERRALAKAQAKADKELAKTEKTAKTAKTTKTKTTKTAKTKPPVIIEIFDSDASPVDPDSDSDGPFPTLPRPRGRPRSISPKAPAKAGATLAARPRAKATDTTPKITTKARITKRKDPFPTKLD